MWLVINIGCIERGVSSNVVGLFGDKTRADAVAEKLDSEMSWREGGQNSYEVFELPKPEVIAEEYREAVAAVPSEQS